MERYVCVHGHFYQPPRESPWLEMVEQQDAAYPFHDWNERITAECYQPNTRARILDDSGRITTLVNNYARMSFNVGPTLLAWMKEAAPTTYTEILAADRRSAARFGGHGSAMAQVYNHVIMPLAPPRDQRTQVVWGIRDFRHRFRREPEGMWLAETAVDDDTLDLLAEQGIRFVVLSPYQAARTRPLDPDETWKDVLGGRVDPTMPYLVRLPSGAAITVFFYDGPISQGVAFEGLLESADRFEARLLEGFGPRAGPQLVNIATDGESYGHHHRHGEMALAATLARLGERDDVHLTNYGEFLARFPPTHEAQVVQASSWSCAHGVERWRADCGCSTGEPGRHQRWRAPLRAALEDLQVRLADQFELLAAPLLRDPWAARDDYIDVVLDRDGNLPGFLERHAVGPLASDERRAVVQLLEVQRNALLMFTSCGWFFDELSRPEPVQVLKYAARAMQLMRSLGAEDLEPAFVAALSRAESNDPHHPNGAAVYDHLVRPAIASLEQVGAHFAISSLSWTYDRVERIGAYEVLRDVDELHEAGGAKLAFGRLTVRSVVTLNQAALEFGALHLGDHTFACGVRLRGDDEAYATMATSLTDHFDRADFVALVHALDEHFGPPSYSLRTLFRDERRRVLDMVLQTTVDEVEAAFRGIYRSRAPLMRFLADVGASLPAGLRGAAAVVLNAELHDELATTTMDLQHVRSLLEEAERFDITLDDAGLAHTLSRTVARLAGMVGQHLEDDRLLTEFGPTHEETLQRADVLLEAVELVPFDVELVPAQDVIWRVLRDHHPSLQDRAAAGDAAAARWLGELGRLAEEIGVAVPQPSPAAEHARIPA